MSSVHFYLKEPGEYFFVIASRGLLLMLYKDEIQRYLEKFLGLPNFAVEPETMAEVLTKGAEKKSKSNNEVIPLVSRLRNCEAIDQKIYLEEPFCCVGKLIIKE